MTGKRKTNVTYRKIVTGVIFVEVHDIDGQHGGEDDHYASGDKHQGTKFKNTKNSEKSVNGIHVYFYSCGDQYTLRDRNRLA